MQNIKIIGISLLFIFSFLFLKEGFTGMFTFKEEDLCQYNTECLLPRVCCKFYQEERGICSWQDNCQGIYLTTKNEKMQSGKLTEEKINEIAFEIEQPQKIRENSPLIVIGLMLLITATMYLVSRMHRKEEKVKKKQGKLVL